MHRDISGIAHRVPRRTGHPGPSLLNDIREVRRGHSPARPRSGCRIRLWHDWLPQPEAIGMDELRLLNDAN